MKGSRMPKQGILARRWRVFMQWICVGLVLAIALQTGGLEARDLKGGEFRETFPQDIAAQSGADLMQQGEIRFQAEHYLDAITLWQQAATQFQAEGSYLNQARALSAIATALEALAEWQQATIAIEQAIDLLNSLESTLLGRTQLLAQALNIQGNLQLNQGQESEALETWQQAEAAYTAADNPVGIVGSQLNQARAMQALGLYRRALDLLMQVEQSLMQQPNSPLNVSVLWELGNVLRLVGDLEQAYGVLQQSLSMAEQLQASGQLSAMESAATLSGIRISLGNLARTQGDFNLARSLYQQAIATAPFGLNVQAQVLQLSLLVELAQWADVQTLWADIQPQLSELPLNQAAIYTQINAAQSLIQWDKSGWEGERVSENTIAQLLATVIQHARALGDRKAESYGLGILGHLYEETRQWAEAQQLTQDALRLAQTINASDIAYLWYWQSGRLFVAQEQEAITSHLPNHLPADLHNKAIVAYTEAVEILQSLRSDLVAINPNVQFSFREGVEPVYRQLVELLLRSAPDGEPSQSHLRHARQVIEQLQLAELDNFFREACLNVSSVEIDQVAPKTAVIYPIILPDRLAVILSLPNQPLHYFATALSQTEVERLLRQMRQSLRPNSFLQDRLPIAQQIYNLLLRPSEADLIASEISTLVFVPDGSLRGLPMAALHDGQQYLIEKYSIALTPGLQLLQPQPLQQRRLRALVAGLSQTRQGFPALPNVAFEVEQIASEITTQVLLNQSFTNSRFQTRLNSSSASIVHLATHGQFSSNADNTFILTWDDRITVKQLHQILQTRDSNLNPIELLVLSACQTAAGDRRAALGMAGVAVRSGARSTLATLWSVSDRSTATFMATFYQELGKPGTTKADALRRAQLALLHSNSYQAPFYWAPFVLLGNWL
jgi:CHAT domain-containing protein